jgi:hypothetical protein
MNITAWRQSPDYSTDDAGEVTLQQGEEIIRSFPWAEQLRVFVDELSQGKDVCAPGVGFCSDNVNETFHLYVQDDDSWRLHLSLTRPGKFLGIFPKPNRDLDVDVESMEKGCSLLRLFHADDRTELIVEAERNRSSLDSPLCPGA